MAGFMKNAMSYLGMSDVVDDEDDYIEEDEEQKPAPKSAFDSDHTVTPLASTTAPAASSTTKPFPGGRVNRITTIHPKSYEDAQLVGRAVWPKPWHIALWTSPPAWCSACVVPSSVSLRACSC